jgi:transposase-like protein
VAISVFNSRPLQDESAAYRWVEAQIWPDGPICPHCGGVERISPMKGRSTRIGAYKCYQCRKPFTVKVGTVFESSHIPMRVWLQAMVLMCASKKGVSSNQLHRTLGVSLKTAWFMSHRIREAMRVVGMEPMGGAGKAMEADESFFGRVKGSPNDAVLVTSMSSWRSLSAAVRHALSMSKVPALPISRPSSARTSPANPH